MHGVPRWELNLKSLDANKWKVWEENNVKKFLKESLKMFIQCNWRISSVYLFNMSLCFYSIYYILIFQNIYRHYWLIAFWKFITIWFYLEENWSSLYIFMLWCCNPKRYSSDIPSKFALISLLYEKRLTYIDPIFSLYCQTQ